MNYDKEILVTEIAPVGGYSRTLFIRMGDILYIDTYTPKTNYLTLRFVTRNGRYRPALTIGDCRTGISEFVQLDRGVLINMREVEYIADHTYVAYARFKDSTISVEIARTHLTHFRELVRLKCDHSDIECDKRSLIHDMNEKKIFAVPVDGQQEHYFKRDELLFIQNWKKSSKIEVPMFYTKRGRFTVCTSLASVEETMPTFERFQKWNVVNKLAVSRIESTPHGYVVFFKDTDTIADISFVKYKKLDLHCAIREERFIVATKDKVAQWLPLEEVCYIDLPEIRRGVRVLRLHTKDDMFFMDMTLRGYSEMLELTAIDSGIYANFNNMKHIEVLPYGGIVHFVCPDYTTTIARQRIKLFQEIVPIIET